MSHISPGDTAFVLMCAALVAIMTPGLAFFYGGLVRHKNVITIMMQSFASLGIVTISGSRSALPWPSAPTITASSAG